MAFLSLLRVFICIWHIWFLSLSFYSLYFLILKVFCLFLQSFLIICIFIILSLLAIYYRRHISRPDSLYLIVLSRPYFQTNPLVGPPLKIVDRFNDEFWAGNWCWRWIGSCGGMDNLNAFTLVNLTIRNYRDEKALHIMQAPVAFMYFSRGSSTQKTWRCLHRLGGKDFKVLNLLNKKMFILRIYFL